jgi:hypothetical protein
VVIVVGNFVALILYEKSGKAGKASSRPSAASRLYSNRYFTMKNGTIIIAGFG